MKIEFSGSRRTFLKCAAVFGGFAALLGRIGPASAKTNQPLPQGKESGKGYRLTDHVKKYYRTARL